MAQSLSWAHIIWILFKDFWVVGNCVSLHFYVVNFFSKVCLKDRKVLSIWDKDTQYFYSIKNNFTQGRCHSHTAISTRNRVCPTAYVRWAVPSFVPLLYTLLYSFVPLSLCPRLGSGRDAAEEQSSNCFPFTLIQVVGRDEATDKALGLFISLSPPLFSRCFWKGGEEEMPWSSALVSREEGSALSGISIAESMLLGSWGDGEGATPQESGKGQLQARRSPAKPSTYIPLMAALKINLKCYSG